jgi:hypothetical protein
MKTVYLMKILEGASKIGAKEVLMFVVSCLRLL